MSKTNVLFNKMMTNTKVRVEKEYRRANKDSFYLSSSWFDVVSVNNDKTIDICSRNGFVFGRVNIDNIV